MPDLSRLARRAILAGARTARRLPGTPGGMGVYFWSQHATDEDPASSPWRHDVDALLGHADRSLTAGRIDAALRWFDKALRISYHAALHQSGSSPLAADPANFLRPLRQSRVGRILLERPMPSGTPPHRPPPRDRGDRPARLLVIAQQNWTFVRPLLDALEEQEGIEIRTLEVDDLAPPGFADRDQILRSRFDVLQGGNRLPAPPELVAEYEWADTVLVEWAHHVLTWVTMLDHAPRSLAVRLHRFEVFTPFPLLTDLSRIDRMLYVSPAVRAQLCAIREDVASVPATRVGNLLSRGLGPEPTAEKDPYLLVQVGWLRRIKDVLFSLDVLEALRDHDPRYRLRLIGPGLPGDPSGDSSYEREVRHRIDALDPGAVEMLGRREDVPELLADAAVVLSSSRHEGTHEAIMEGMAAGCVAVVRDWPETAAYGGAASVYDERWVAADVEAAVRQVLALRDPAVAAESREAARAFAVAHRDPRTVVTAYRDALDLAPRHP